MPENKPKLKVLISCYACGPNHGSEPGLGWNIVTELSQFCDLHVLVEKTKWEKLILDEMAKQPHLKKINFYFIAKKRNKLLRRLWPPSYYWFYKKWQQKAYVLSKELHKKEFFDVVHQFNMIGFREPGYLWKLDNVPFVWGPVGGFAQVKWSFIPRFDLKDMVFYLCRNVINIIQIRTKRRVKRAMNSADILISATIESQTGIKKFFNRESILINETGAKVSSFNFSKDNQVFTIIWVGMIIGRKSLDIAIKAISSLPDDVQVKFEIVGNGSNYEKMRNLSKKLNIESKCVFNGHLSHDQTLDIIRRSDIMLFTSLQEGTPHVVLEALSQGIPVICHDINGQSTVVDSTCGIKVPLENYSNSVKYFSEAIKDLYDKKDKLISLSKGAFEKAYQLSWENKAKEIYMSYFGAMKIHNEKNKTR